MVPPLTFAQMLVQLKLMTSQTANFTFTDDELTQALSVAWNDTFVCDSVWDSSLTYTVGNFNYPLPDTVTVVTDLYYQPVSTDAPQKISPDLYFIEAGAIQFTGTISRWIWDTETLYIKGRYKLQTTDLLDSDNLINYVLSNAAYILLRQLTLKYTFLFLKNDTTLSDIINARRDMQGDKLTYKQALLREFEGA